MGGLLNLAQDTIVALDAVGTLIVPAEPVAETYARLGHLAGSKLDPAEIARRFRESFREHWSARNDSRTSEELESRRWRLLVHQVFADVPTACDRLFDQLWEHYAQADAWKLTDYASSLIEQLQGRRQVWGIASNFDQRLHQILPALPPLNQADFCLTSADIGWCKSSSRFYSEVKVRLEKQLRVAYQSGATDRPISEPRWLMIGDDPINDGESPIEAGWQAIVIGDSSPTSGFESVGSIQELITHLES